MVRPAKARKPDQQAAALIMMRRQKGIDRRGFPGGAGLPPLLEVVREARARSGRDPSSFVVTVSSDLRAATLVRLETLRVDRAVVFVGAPSADRIRRLAASRS